MPTITLSVRYNVNVNNPLSTQDLKDNFLSSIPTDLKGESISDSTIEFYLQSAKDFLEDYLGLRIGREVITESKDYYLDDWMQWGFINTTYPVQAAVGLGGFLGTSRQITYPKEWLTTRNTSDGKTYARKFQLIPTGGTLTYENTGVLYLGSGFPLLNWWRTNRGIPSYWQLEYITGFPGDKIPADILQALGMIATIPLLGIIGDAYAGRRGLGFGVSSKSISLDGLSQSVSSASSAEKGIFAVRIKQYGDTLFGVPGRRGLLDTLKDAYSQIIFTSC